VAQFMARRHLFDNGHPVSAGTLLAGSEVLLAIARHSLRRSHDRLASSLQLLADSSERLLGSLARQAMARAELAESRENNGRRAREYCLASTAQPGKSDPRLEPSDRAPRAQAHRR
jgi:hypothetical protein